MHEHALGQPVRSTSTPPGSTPSTPAGALWSWRPRRAMPGEAADGRGSTSRRWRTPTRPHPQGPQDYALKPLRVRVRGRRRLRAARALGLRQDHAAQHHLGPGAPERGPGAVRRPGRHRALPPAQRNIAQVFQFPVIYDTMTVAENLAFPLRNRGVAPGATSRRGSPRSPSMLDLEPLMKRAAGLTADQKQKISLGRGLVREDVAAILFDEPLTVIDPHLKWLLRRKLKQVHASFQHTLVYVTHDQNEALTFAEQVVVMTRARWCSSARRRSCSSGRRTRFVGYFIGSPGMNFLPCRLDGDGSRIDGTDAVLGEPGPRPRASEPRRQAGARHPPEFVGVARGRRRHGHCRSRSRGSRISATTSWSRRGSGRTRSRPSWPRTRRCRRGRAPRASAGAHAALRRRAADRLTGRHGQDPEQRRVAAGPAGARAGRVQRDHPADDRGQLLGAGHLRPERAGLRRHRVVQGGAGRRRPARRPAAAASCSPGWCC